MELHADGHGLKWSSGGRETLSMLHELAPPNLEFQFIVATLNSPHRAFRSWVYIRPMGEVPTEDDWVQPFPLPLKTWMCSATSETYKYLNRLARSPNLCFEAKRK